MEVNFGVATKSHTLVAVKATHLETGRLLKKVKFDKPVKVKKGDKMIYDVSFDETVRPIQFQLSINDKIIIDKKYDKVVDEVIPVKLELVVSNKMVDKGYSPVITTNEKNKENK